MLADLDFAVVRWLNQFAGLSPSFDRFLVAVAGATLCEGGIFMAYFWWLWFRRRNDGKADRVGVVVALAGAVIAVTVARIMQVTLPMHDRPLHTPALDFVLPAGVAPETLNHWSSFPSDHAVLFIALSTAVWQQSRRLGIVAFAWTLLVICLPRIYLGFHYPSDIVGGVIVGVPLMLAVQRLARRSTIPDRILHFEAMKPALFYGLAFVVTYQVAVLFLDVRALANAAYHMLTRTAGG